LTMYADQKIQQQIKAIQANGLLQKDITAPVLRERIVAIMQGADYFEQYSPVPVRGSQKDNFQEHFKLSKRELEVIQHIKEGRSTKEISEHFNLSIYTIETHRKNINRKLQVKNVAELLLILADYPL